jgi:type I site-specific restriction endonuclease
MNFTLKSGRMVVRGRHASRDKESALYADYVLCFKPGLPIAAIEAKDNNHAIGARMAQAIKYAGLLEARRMNCLYFVIAVECDATTCQRPPLRTNVSVHSTSRSLNGSPLYVPE